MKDKVIVCKDCGQEFIFSEKGQAFFKEKGFADPIRCKVCRSQKKARQSFNERNNIQ